MKRAWLTLALLGAGCEENEHPFNDLWTVSCSVPNFPVLRAVFSDPRALDDRGRVREYRGYVEESTFRTWILEVEVDITEGTVDTVVFEAVPAQAHEGLPPVDLQVLTFDENEETTAATMTGTCSLGDEVGDLVMSQGDDCDLCPDCSVVGAIPSAGVVALALLALRRRRGASTLATPAR